MENCIWKSYLAPFSLMLASKNGKIIYLVVIKIIKQTSIILLMNKYPSKSPKNTQYILGSTKRQTFPHYNQGSTPPPPRYFANNRSGNQKRLFTSYISQEVHAPSNYSQLSPNHCHCVHAANNFEVVTELKKLINLIDEQRVSEFNPEGDDIQKQALILSQENLKLSKLVQQLRQKEYGRSPISQEKYESQLNILKKQLENQEKQSQLKQQSLLRTNKTLSSQMKSLSDKNMNLQRELHELKAALQEKQHNDSLKDEQAKRKTDQQKLSFSRIKQQYNESVKVLKNNLSYEVETKINEYEAVIRQYKIRLDTLQNRLRNCEKVNSLNLKLDVQNKKLSRDLAKINQSSRTIDLQIQQELVKLQRDNRQKDDKIAVLNKQFAQTKIHYQNFITELKMKNAQQGTKLAQTQIQVKKLMQNYEQEIRILKKEAKNNVCNHQGLEQDNQKYWQEILNLRNQLAIYTADKSELQDKVYGYESQISKLKHQINNDHLNYVAQTKLLESENSKLRRQLQNKDASLKSIPDLEEENQRLRKDLLQKSNLLASNNTFGLQNQKLKGELRYANQKNRQLEQDKQNLLAQFNEIRNECNKMQQDYKKSLAKQIQDLKQFYDKQINSLQNKNRQLSNELIDLKSKYDHLEYNLQNKHYDQFKTKDDKIYDQQLQIRKLNKIIEDYENQLAKLEESNKKLVEEKEELLDHISTLRISNESNIRKSSEKWENEIEDLKVNYEKQINILSAKLKEKEQNEKNILKIVSKFTKFRGESLKKQLQQLKQLVIEGNFEKLSEQMLKISENYERQLIRSEQKTMQINSLANQKNSLLDKISQLQKMQLVLQEKVNILSGSIKLIQEELKERKIQCQNLLNQKVILQKQNIMLKKLRVDKEIAQNTKARAREISLKIQKLLVMEQQRDQDIMQASKVYSDVCDMQMTESVTRKM